MHISWLDHMLTGLSTLDRDPEAEAEEKIEEEKVAAVEEETAVVETAFAGGDWEAPAAGFAGAAAAAGWDAGAEDWAAAPAPSAPAAEWGADATPAAPPKESQW